MESRNILIAHPKTNEEVLALKAFMAALKIKFEVANEDSYDPEFVKKIVHSKKQIAEGNFTEVKPENLESFIDSL
ncbi:MAG: hypothetical protein MH472_09430 [Bacteroidia bacterium]|nr:hypothetical protein [Bacteroidia bacterium]MDP3928821.1 hypothetical protein [Bacteroidota bacterium]